MSKRSHLRLLSDKPCPEVGDDVYVPTRWFIDRGQDDTIGGLAKVKAIRHIYGGVFLDFEEIDARLNWYDWLEPQQEELRAEFGSQRARPDPDP
jgi:hypothetical protein